MRLLSILGIHFHYEKDKCYFKMDDMRKIATKLGLDKICSTTRDPMIEAIINGKRQQLMHSASLNQEENSEGVTASKTRKGSNCNFCLIDILLSDSYRDFANLDSAQNRHVMEARLPLKNDEYWTKMQAVYVDTDHCNPSA
jgi:hypothetical protein